MVDQLNEMLNDVRRVRSAIFLRNEEVSGALWLIEQKLNDFIVENGEYLEYGPPPEPATEDTAPDEEEELPF